MSSEKNKKGAKLNTVGCCGVKYILAHAQYSRLLWCESLYRIMWAFAISFRELDAMEPTSTSWAYLAVTKAEYTHSPPANVESVGVLLPTLSDLF